MRNLMLDHFARRLLEPMIGGAGAALATLPIGCGPGAAAAIAGVRYDTTAKS